MSLTKKMAAVLASATLAFGLTACGRNTETETVTETVDPTTATATAESTTTVKDDDDAGDDADNTSTANSAAGSEAPEITIDGAAVSGIFTPVHCTNETDDGEPELNIDTGNKDDNAENDELEVEIKNPEGSPRLGDLSVERANDKEFELTDEQKNAATVSKDSSTWTITGEGHFDDDESTAIPFEVKVNCPA